MDQKPTKIWKVAAVFFGGFTVLFVGFLLFLPRTYLVSRPALVDVPRKAAYDVVSDLSTWAAWAVWLRDLDDTIKVEVSEEDGFQVLRFSGQKLGGGSFRVTELKPPDQITLQAQVGSDGSSGLHRFQFEQADGQTRIVWSMIGNAGDGPLAGLTVGTREQLAVHDFDDSLLALKACLEAGGCRKD